MGGLRLSAVELHVHDVAGVAAFYRDVIGVALEPGDEAATHFECSSGQWGGSDFFFFAVQPVGPRGVTTAGVQVGFEVNSLEEIHARVVAAGADVVEPPTDRPWGRAATYADPAGNLVQLTEG